MKLIKIHEKGLHISGRGGKRELVGLLTLFNLGEGYFVKVDGESTKNAHFCEIDRK